MISWSKINVDRSRLLGRRTLQTDGQSPETATRTERPAATGASKTSVESARYSESKQWDGLKTHISLRAAR